MKPSNQKTKLRANDRLLVRSVWLALVAVVVVGVAFGGYYYWDRYVHLGDKSPLDLGVEHLEQLVRENPDDPEPRVALAQYYFDNGLYEQAIDQSQQVLRAFPDNEGAAFILGVSYVHVGQPEAAIEPLEQFAAVRRESPMANVDTVLEAALYYLGQSYLELGQPDRAIEVLAEALTINRTDADAMYQLGLAYSQNGNHDLAIEQYENAVRFVPDFAEAYSGMIASHAALGRPNYVAYARGMEAFSLNDYEVARIHLESAVASLPDFAPAFLGLGLTYEQLGDLPAAEANLARALELNPEDFAAMQALGRVRLQLGNDEE